MEGLVHSRFNPVHATRIHYHSRLIPAFSILFSKNFTKTPPLEASGLGHFDNTLPSKVVITTFLLFDEMVYILQLWRSADAVCFDVDSTVCLDEGIDELAEFCGAGKAVAEWTARAMGGSVPFEEALAARLSLFKPSLLQVQEFLETRPPKA
ncbi:3-PHOSPHOSERINE PHOSPHATASE family protein [Salix suchowensis]|nr:3-PHOSPHOSERINE PHOSPHATASE family protein [Salix suchowensis]